MTLEPTDLDRRIWEEELEKFLPKQLFDAHLHFFNDDHCLSQPDEVHSLAFGRVCRRIDFDKDNAFAATQAVDDPTSRVLMLVHPSFPVDKAAHDVDQYGFCGLNPCRFWAPDDANYRITDIIPNHLLSWPW